MDRLIERYEEIQELLEDTEKITDIERKQLLDELRFLTKRLKNNNPLEIKLKHTKHKRSHTRCDVLRPFTQETKKMHKKLTSKKMRNGETLIGKGNTYRKIYNIKCDKWY